MNPVRVQQKLALDFKAGYAAGYAEGFKQSEGVSYLASCTRSRGRSSALLRSCKFARPLTFVPLHIFVSVTSVMARGLRVTL